MRKRILGWMICLSAILFNSCSSVSVFYSPNHFKNVEGNVILSGGDKISGLLSFNNEVLVRGKMGVKRENKKEKILLHDIAAVEVEGNTYHLRHVSHGLNLSENLFFMKRLTPSNSAIHLYEHSEKHTNHRSSPRITYQPKYYIQFPNEHRYTVWALDSKRLQPHFHQKMSEVVDSCASLAEKIRNKERGYFYSILSASEKERADIVLKIINEYNSCKNRTQ